MRTLWAQGVHARRVGTEQTPALVASFERSVGHGGMCMYLPKAKDLWRRMSAVRCMMFLDPIPGDADDL